MANAAAAFNKKSIAGKGGARRKPARPAQLSGRVRDAISIAEGKGLFDGGRVLVVRARMPAALVAQAKRRTGITSDSKLLEAALASLAVADDYGDWLISQRDTVSPEIDLEF